LAWLRHAGREDSVLDGVSPPLRGLASDFSLRGQIKISLQPVNSTSCIRSNDVENPGYPPIWHLKYIYTE
ncbi:MAG: hypothetical protein ACRDC6_21920, partial [Shewanella sp.]